MEEQKLTDEQLWLLCEEHEKELKIKDFEPKYHDKGIDYEFWGMMYEKSKDLK
jgi:hypothetical protein